LHTLLLEAQLFIAIPVISLDRPVFPEMTNENRREHPDALDLIFLLIEYFFKNQLTTMDY
jgi:hypothetical protein